MKRKNKSIATPKKIIVNALRYLWLQSRERAFALKRDKYTCSLCNKKQSKKKGNETKVIVHHIKKADLDIIVECIREHLLMHPDFLQTLCEDCHEKIHKEEEI